MKKIALFHYKPKFSKKFTHYIPKKFSDFYPLESYLKPKGMPNRWFIVFDDETDYEFHQNLLIMKLSGTTKLTVIDQGKEYQSILDTLAQVEVLNQTKELAKLSKLEREKEEIEQSIKEHRANWSNLMDRDRKTRRELGVLNSYKEKAYAIAISHILQENNIRIRPSDQEMIKKIKKRMK